MKNTQKEVKIPNRRLFFITYCFPPNAEAGVHRSSRFVKYLKQFGWEIVVLTADPSGYLPDTPVEPALLKGVPPEVEVVRTPVMRGLTSAIRFRNQLKRTFFGKKENTSDQSPGPDKGKTELRWFQSLKDAITSPFGIPDNHGGWFWWSVIKGYRMMRKKSFDVIYSSAPPWTAHLIAYTLSSLTDVPWVADFRDPWARNPWKQSRSKLQKYMADFLEKLVVKKGRFVILNTDWAREEYRSFYKDLDGEKFQLIPNGYDPEAFAKIKISSLPRNECFNLVHAGSLYGGRDPVPLLKGCALFVQNRPGLKQRFLLSFIGVGGRQKDHLQKTIWSLGLDKYVELVPRVSHREALNRMACAHLLLILQGGTSLCIPAKLYEYMALDKPILGLTPDGATADLIRTYPTGRIVDPDNPTEIAMEIEHFFNVWRKDESVITGLDCWDTETFSAPRLTKQLQVLLQKVLD